MGDIHGIKNQLVDLEQNVEYTEKPKMVSVFGLSGGKNDSVIHIS